MVRSTSSSCFKIITCGTDSIDDDNLEKAESKGSTDKRQWSFRKRSARHRVLSNNMISETPSIGNKESPESVTIDFRAQNNPTVPEKISVSQWTDEGTPLSTAANSTVPNHLIAMENACKIGTFISTESTGMNDSLTTMENASKIDPNVEEYVATVIQTAIRGYLAHRVLLKLKNVVKLQAAVRGHLVRRQAEGTLRCVQAIVKMQALVRARRVQMALRDPDIESKLDMKNEKINQRVKPLGKENPGTRPGTEKFLSNGFARQLLESTPKKKPIRIKCDPSRPDSTWKWLERWMSVPSLDFARQQKPQFSPENEEQGERTDITVSGVGTEIPAEVISESADLNSCIREAEIPLESEENLITYDADNLDFQFGFPTSSIRDDMKQPDLEDAGLNKAQETSSNIYVNKTDMQQGASSQTVLDSVSNKPEADCELRKHSMKKVAHEQPETEGKKFVFASRKSCNPAFVAVQSKFEELSLAATSARPIGSHQDVRTESKFYSLSHPVDFLTRTKEHGLAENMISHDPRIYLGGSECGTELSISSTLDSPDRSEVAGGELENESKVVESAFSDPNGSTNNASNIENLYVEAKNDSSTSLPNSLYSVSAQPENLDYVDGEAVDSIVVVDSPWVGQQPERSASDVQIRLDTTTDGQAHSLSPEGSPRSHITAPESHGTPSSWVSVKAKRNRLNKSGPTENRKSQSEGKGSSSNRNHDSVVRNSIEKLPKDSKNGKRRDSFASARPDHVDQEPRDSFSNTIPSYMQATASARAKAHANNSPRSSPDLQDKEIFIKKRHSLPGTNGKQDLQDSPRTQPSISQVQQGAKGKHTHSPRERWQR